MDKKLAELRQERATVLTQMKALAEKEDKDFTVEDQKSFTDLTAKADALLADIERKKAVQDRMAKTAEPVEGQPETKRAPAAVKSDPYEKDVTLIIGGCAKMLAIGKDGVMTAGQAAAQLYGENHPVTKALVTNIGTAGGFAVAPDVASEIIEILRPKAVVRSAGPRSLPMPRGTMHLPGQGSTATASYGAESRPAGKSQPSLRGIVASFKKLKALVPVSNDMIRYANPAFDAFVRDDIVKVMALREDRAFLFDDGTLDTPKGMLTFANQYAVGTGGTAGVFSSSANSVAAAGGNFLTSTSAYTLATVAAELGGLVNKLDAANVDEDKRVWFMHPRSYNYLYNVQNALGVYVYRDELNKGTLLGYPFKKSTQFSVAIWNADGSNKDCSFVILAEMADAMILDSMQLELAVSREGSYTDENGNSQSAFANDETVIRAIAEHDFQMRHDEAIAVLQFVRWAPAIS
ncbi:MAG: phage major capsid protein [Alphaproteobacteria bacterium]|nr:MAG: phage major capsid protein [Alphaproteobacteria bacterium]